MGQGNWTDGNLLVFVDCAQALDDEAVASLIPGLTPELPSAAVPLLVPTAADGATQGTAAAPKCEVQALACADSV